MQLFMHACFATGILHLQAEEARRKSEEVRVFKARPYSGAPEFRPPTESARRAAARYLSLDGGALAVRGCGFL